jgi:hypothetical protein
VSPVTTDLFGQVTFEGVVVELERGCNWCQSRTMTICGPGRGPHAASLTCSHCGRTGGWLSKEQMSAIRCIVGKFGLPPGPIKVRKTSNGQIAQPGDVIPMRDTQEETDNE